MSFQNRATNLAAYQMVATHGGVASADPHRLVLMLLDGALSRLAQARGCMDRDVKAARLVNLNKALAIVAELRACLDLSQGEIAGNLDSLYDYMTRQLLKAHVEDGAKAIDEVARLLQEVRGAWLNLPAALRSGRQALP
jgi:flagellar secretion chaperone FliS